MGTKGANAVDEILRMEKIRQSVAIKEILVVRNKNLTPVQSMRKTLSVPNISNGMRNSFSLDNVSGLRLKSSETFQELSLELSGRGPRSFASTHSNEYSQSLSNRNSGLKRLPMSMTMSTLHEDRNQVQDVDLVDVHVVRRGVGSLASAPPGLTGATGVIVEVAELVL